ncbi:MAG TPA: hypothetical protein VGH28_28355 [Polyangiaceae bacterium]|jgi:hypothetical protein
MKRALLLFSLMVACNADQTSAQPTPPLVLDAGNPAPAAPRRMAFHRSPFGDALQADNLMIDGDFELTGRTDQAPWITFDPTQGQVTLDYDTGGHCRSGIRCAVLAAPDVLVGYMGSPMLTNIHVRAYAKVSTGKCSDVDIFAIDLEDNTTGKSVTAPSKTPGPDGWCVYDGDVDDDPLQQPALYVQPAAKASVTLDDVTALPIGEAPVHGITPPPSEMDVATKARMKTTIAWLRAHRKYGRP